MAEHNETGKMGEEMATRYLARKGYSIIARNWSNLGRKELDIVAIDGNTLVFVEVKTRSANPLVSALEAVNREKRHHMTLAATSFMRTFRLEMKARFDIITITGNELEHIENAFIGE